MKIFCQIIMIILKILILLIIISLERNNNEIIKDIDFYDDSDDDRDLEPVKKCIDENKKYLQKQMEH